MEPAHEHIHGGDDIYGDVVDDGMIESLIIVGLAAALAFLVYYRQQRQLNNQRQTQNQQAGGAGGGGAGEQGLAQPGQQPLPEAGHQQDRGLFPNPGDPDFGQWVAGGVAH